MLKRKVASILVGGLLLAAGAATAAESAFPDSVNETASSEVYVGNLAGQSNRDLPAASSSVFPSGVSEVGPSDVYSVEVRSPDLINIVRFTGSAAPASINETGIYR